MGGDIRIGTTERNETRALLDIHLAEGRLSLAEHEDRCALAGVAQTRADIDTLFTDLPAPHPEHGGLVRPGSAAPAQLVDTPVSEALTVLAGSSIVLGIPGAILLTIFLGAWWVIPLVVVIAIIAGSLAELARKPPGAAP